MNSDQMEGKWKQAVGKVKEKWGKLTDDDLTAINGQKEQLVGKIQERYGIAKEAAQKQVDEFMGTFKDESDVQVNKTPLRLAGGKATERISNGAPRRRQQGRP